MSRRYAGPADREVAITKAWTSSACQRVAQSAQQPHGGIGVDMEYDLQFHHRRAKALELSLGAAHIHPRALEGRITAGENAPWARQ